MCRLSMTPNIDLSHFSGINHQICGLLTIVAFCLLGKLGLVHIIFSFRHFVDTITLRILLTGKLLFVQKLDRKFGSPQKIDRNHSLSFRSFSRKVSAYFSLKPPLCAFELEMECFLILMGLKKIIWDILLFLSAL